MLINIFHCKLCLPRSCHHAESLGDSASAYQRMDLVWEGKACLHPTLAPSLGHRDSSKKISLVHITVSKTPWSSPLLCLCVSFKQIPPYSPFQTLSAQWHVLQSCSLCWEMNFWFACSTNHWGCQGSPLGPSTPLVTTCVLYILECLSCRKTCPEKV